MRVTTTCARLYFCDYQRIRYTRHATSCAASWVRTKAGLPLMPTTGLPNLKQWRSFKVKDTRFCQFARSWLTWFESMCKHSKRLLARHTWTDGLPSKKVRARRKTDQVEGRVVGLGLRTGTTTWKRCCCWGLLRFDPDCDCGAGVGDTIWPCGCCVHSGERRTNFPIRGEIGFGLALTQAAR